MTGATRARRPEANEARAPDGARSRRLPVQARSRKRVEHVLGSPVRFDDGLWAPSASVGIALSDPDDGPADVLRRADHQMYVNKRARRAETTGDTLPA